MLAAPWCAPSEPPGTFASWLELTFSSTAMEDMCKIAMVCWALWKENSYGFGMVARDHLGSPLHIHAAYHGGYFPPEVIEAMGIKEALSWIKAYHWKGVTIESDSMLVVQAIHSTQLMTFVFGLVVNDCRTLLSSLSDIQLRFVRPSANRAAHYVARHARSLTGRSILGLSILRDLQIILYSEC
uniref:RNase H type-1 domain-containing protein n=1 Tax=Cannabis sativa TaxID=3483 RepID=A0A803NW35_CANSA